MKKYKKVVISAGHGGNKNKLVGAVGNGHYEHNLNVEVMQLVGTILKGQVDYVLIDEDKAETASQNVNNIVKGHKAQGVDKEVLDISIHFNAGGGTGVEVLYNDNDMRVLAKELSEGLAKAQGLRNRGEKYRSNLGFLNGLKGDLLIEVGFIDSQQDIKAYQKNKVAVANTIATFIKKYVDVKEEVVTVTGGQAHIVTILVDKLNIRAKDDVNSKIIQVVKKGERYKAGKIGKWGIQVGRGYCSKSPKYVKIEKR